MIGLDLLRHQGACGAAEAGDVGAGEHLLGQLLLGLVRGRVKGGARVKGWGWGEGWGQG